MTERGRRVHPGKAKALRQAAPKTDSADAASRKKTRLVWLVLAAILLVGAMLRASYLREIVHNPDFSLPQVDPAYHDYWARGLALGDWTLPKNLGNWSDPQIRSTPYLRPPGYPSFLAGVHYLTGGSYLAARIAQMSLGLVNCILAFGLGRRLFGPVTALIFAFLMSTYWAFIYFEGELMEPVLLVTLGLLLLHILSFWADRFTFARGLAAGIMVGLFALTRTNILVIVPIVLGWSWWVARRRKDQRRLLPVGLGFIAGMAVTIAPVTIRNWVVSKDVVLVTSNMGISLYSGNHKGANGAYSFPAELKELGIREEDWQTCFDYLKVVQGVEQKLGRKVKQSEVSSYFTHKGLEFVRSHPIEALKLVAIKTAFFWGPQEVSSNKINALEKAHSATLRHLPGFQLPLSLALFGLIQFFRTRRTRGESDEVLPARSERAFEMSVLIVLIVLVYFASYLPFFVVGRYRIPVIPFLLLFGAYGLHRLGQWLLSARYRAAAGWLAVLVVLYAAASVRLASYEPSKVQWHLRRATCYRLAEKPEMAMAECRAAIAADATSEEGHRRLADMLYQKRNYAEAAEHYAAAVALRPDYTEARYNLAMALLAQGRHDEAIMHLRWVVEHDPSVPDAHFLLGRALRETGDVEGAVRQYHKAIESRPDYYQAHNNLANILIAQGKADEAIEHYRLALEIKPDYTTARQNLDRLLRSKGRSD